MTGKHTGYHPIGSQSKDGLVDRVKGSITHFFRSKESEEAASLISEDIKDNEDDPDYSLYSDDASKSWPSKCTIL